MSPTRRQRGEGSVSEDTRYTTKGSAMIDEAEGLHLFSSSLLSKWGFGDGDLPDPAWDLIDEHGIDFASLDWHSVLRGLVRDFLLPALDQRVDVYDIETIHNPIRAKSVDGIELSDAVMFGDAPKPTLTPDYVTVPWSIVLDRCHP